MRLRVKRERELEEENSDDDSDSDDWRPVVGAWSPMITARRKMSTSPKQVSATAYTSNEVSDADDGIQSLKRASDSLTPRRKI